MANEIKKIQIGTNEYDIAAKYDVDGHEITSTYLTADDSATGSAVAINADTLQGHNTAYFASKNQLDTASGVLNARMDTFTQLPTGSTSGDAELMDIRVGIDSTQYASAGTAVRTQISELKENLVDLESEVDTKITLPTIADNNKVPRANNGAVEWVPVGQPTDQQTATAVNAWLDAHPEATTTVQDGSLTEAKFTNNLKLKTIKDYVTPQMFGAVGDGTTDDTNALQAAVDYCNTNGTVLYIPNGTYLLTETSRSFPYPSYPHYGGCVVSFGNLIMIGESRQAILKSEEATVFGFSPTVRDQEMFFIANLTIDGMHTDQTDKTFDQHRKGLQLMAHPEGNYNYRFESVTIENVEVTNCKGEGVYGSHYPSKLTIFRNCKFSKCNASMGNISGNTEYRNCIFEYANSNHSIEFAGSAPHSNLIVTNCSFYNGTAVTNGAIISMLNASEQGALINVIVENNLFENEASWLIANNILSCASLTVYNAEQVKFSNNIVINGALNLGQGYATVLMRTHPKTATIDNNIIKYTVSPEGAPVVYYPGSTVISESTRPLCTIKNNILSSEGIALVQRFCYLASEAPYLDLSNNSINMNTAFQATLTMSEFFDQNIPRNKKVTILVEAYSSESSFVTLNLQNMKTGMVIDTRRNVPVSNNYPSLISFVANTDITDYTQYDPIPACIRFRLQAQCTNENVYLRVLNVKIEDYITETTVNS